MQSTILFLFFALAVCTCCAKVEIIEGNDISIEFDKPFTITFTNDKISDVEFRHQQSVIAYCFGNYGCLIEDERFNIMHLPSAGRNEYILTCRNTNHTDICGVYECNDLLYPEKNSAHVSIIGFDNETCDATEEEDTIHLTTACSFHVSLSDMQIYWYTYDNTTLRLLDENEMEASMTLFKNASVCSHECGTLSAYKFTFGLNIIDEEQGSTDVFIETKIFHPDYMNKPLTWRSSKTFRVKESSPKTPTLMAVIILVSVCVTVSIAIAAVRFQRNKTANAESPSTTIEEFDHSSYPCEINNHNYRYEGKDSQLESAIDARIGFQEIINIDFETRWNTAIREQESLLSSGSIETIEHNYRDEEKDSQLDPSEGIERKTEKRGKTARRRMRELLGSDPTEKEATSSRHVETKPDVECHLPMLQPI